MGGEDEPHDELQRPDPFRMWAPPSVASTGPLPPPPPPAPPRKSFWKSPLKVSAVVAGVVVIALIAVGLAMQGDPSRAGQSVRRSDSLLDDFGVDSNGSNSTKKADVSRALDASGDQVVAGFELERGGNRMVSASGAPESKYLTSSVCTQVSKVSNLDIVGFEQFDGATDLEQGFVGFGVGNDDDLHTWAEKSLALAETLKNDPDHCPLGLAESDSMIGEPVVEVEKTDDAVAVLVVFRASMSGDTGQAGFVIVQHGDWAFLSVVTDTGDVAPMNEFEDAVRLVAQEAVQGIQGQ